MNKVLLFVLVVSSHCVGQGIVGSSTKATVTVDSANKAGWSGGTPDAWIDSAISALPACTGTTGITYAHCGAVYLAQGRYALARTVTLGYPTLSVLGAGSGRTFVTTPPGVCGFVWSAVSAYDNHDKAGTIGGLTLLGNSGASSCGLEYRDIASITLEDVSFLGYSGSGASGLWGNGTSSGLGFSERDHFYDLTFYNNTVGWLMTNNRGSVSTFGYGSFDIGCNTVSSGQVCLSAVGGGPGAQLLISNSTLKVVCNLAGGSIVTTCISLSNNAAFDSLFTVHAEGGPSCRSLASDGSAGTGFNGIGYLELACATSGITRLPVHWDGQNGSFVNGWPTQLSTLRLSSTISNYDGIATVRSGLEAQYAKVDQNTPRMGAVPATKIYSTPSNGAGIYKLTYTATVNQPAAGSSTLGPVLLICTDADTGTVVQVDSASNDGNTTATALGGTLACNAAAGTAVSYQISYQSTGATPMEYIYHLTLSKQ